MLRLETDGSPPCSPRGSTAAGSGLSSALCYPSLTCSADLQLGRKLGCGSFASVVLATCSGTGVRVAVKICTPRTGATAARRPAEDPERERDMLLAAAHPSVVRCVDTFQERGQFYIVMEACTRGCLVPFMRRHAPGGKVWCAAPRLIAEAVLGLEHLDRVGIAHRDIKSDNLLLSSALRLKIADFGSAVLAKDCEAAGFAGTPEFASPELLRDGYCHSSASDLWGLGCVVYDLFAGRPPFTGDGTEAELFQRIAAAQFECPPEVPEDAQDLIRGLLAKEPADRLGVRGGYGALRSAAFFGGVEWDHVHECSDVELSDDDDPADWEQYLLPGESVVRMGRLMKTRYAFSKKHRMLILTDYPRLFYCDPVTRDVKGTVPWGKILDIVVLSPTHFEIKTASRTYDLKGPSAAEWAEAIRSQLGKGKVCEGVQ
eukprot:TRINITY_DN16067_c0_g1_i1.p1 TRINITY_DN16067_c0_g1~~TRINITY_DN16067_c0_g1_i1.p1  ORF type:complete len:447 (+),score=100.11 TRINITY_DN16067_c0_g1_i1:52-1341(+)